MHSDWKQQGRKKSEREPTHEAQAGATAAQGGGDALPGRQPPHVRLAQAAQRECDVAQRGARDGCQEIGLVLGRVDARQQLRRATWVTYELGESHFSCGY